MTPRPRSLLLIACCAAAVFGSSVTAQQQARNSTQPPPLSSQPPPAVDPEQTQTGASQTGEYLIGPEDVLEIVVWKQADLSRTVAVRPDGRISLPLLNDVTAANNTVSQLRDVLAKGYTRFVPEAEVSVMLKEIHSKWISIMGMVKEPGKYPLRNRATVLEGLAMAGGFDTYAKKDQIVIYRQNGRGGWVTINFNYTQMLNKLDGAQQNFILQPGDIIVVP